ncbi:MAG: hypothetical protein Q4E99_01030 [Bacillota bacterium]|nr:hypothetical protein [Bacillota bacterium]
MKKKFIIAISLLCIAVVSAVAAFAFGLQENKVEYQQETLYGSPTFADGITANYQLTSVGHANWYLSYNFGAGFGVDENATFTVEDDFKFLPIGNISTAFYKAQDKYTYSDDDYINNNRYIGVYQSFDANILEEKFLKDFNAEFPKDKEGSFTKYYYLKDIHEYYRPSVGIGANVFSSYSSNRNLAGYDTAAEIKFWNKFYDYFKIPVLENDIIEVTGTRVKSNNSPAIWGFNMVGGSVYVGADGQLHGSEDALSESADRVIIIPDTYCFDSKDVLANDALYFTFSNVTNNGKHADFSQVPGGYGIYKIPYDKEKDTKQGFKEGVLDIDNLQTIFSLNENEQVRNMGLSSDGLHLYLILDVHTGTSASIVFKSINLKTFNVDQEILLEAYRDFCFVKQKKNFIVVRTRYTGNVSGANYDHLKVLYEKNPGVYEMLIDVEMGTMEAKLWENYTPVCACDGKRFAIAAFEQKSVSDYISWNDVGTGIMLAVYEDNELKYVGKYTNSLDLCNIYNLYTAYIAPAVINGENVGQVSTSQEYSSLVRQYFNSGNNNEFNFNIHTQNAEMVLRIN